MADTEMEKKKTPLIVTEDNPDIDIPFKFFCRHLVSLSLRYQHLDDDGNAKGKAKTSHYSGFVLSVNDQWFIATAGHILKDIEVGKRSGKIHIIEWGIHDHFGLNPVSERPIPFNYDDAPKFFIAPDEGIESLSRGLDFAVLGLNSNQKQSLQKNSIVPVSKENWLRQNEVDFDRHIMLGFPEQYVKEYSVSPTMIAVEKIHEILNDIPKTRYPRFVGKLGEKYSLDSIKGMSGGPIFGFRRGSAEQYWIVAIQSAWLSQRRLVIGCPVPVFAELVENQYRLQTHT